MTAVHDPVPLGWCLTGHHAATGPGACPGTVTSGGRALACPCGCHTPEETP